MFGIFSASNKEFKEYAEKQAAFTAAIVDLLIKKGIITTKEWNKALSQATQYMDQEMAKRREAQAEEEEEEEP